MRMSSSMSNSPFILNSRPDFKKVQATRQSFNASLPITVTQSPDPNWKYGKRNQDSKSSSQNHVEIDPYASDRKMISNYKLLISSIPRPISFVSTISKDGHRNLAPFSYFQVVDHDPPTFVIGFSARLSRPKDTRRNLEETGECVINIVSEHMVEGVNATSLDIPFEDSEWELSGFTPALSATVKPERVKQAIFSIEGKLLEMKSLDYHGAGKEGKPTGALAIVEATRFWVQEDCVNEAKDEISLESLRPLVQLGGIQYGRVTETFELPRPTLQTELANAETGLAQMLEKKTIG
jgi:flavin reductase (DIM6/NTAB) family NADH-FMN oxidoreductase RutF